MQVDRKLVKQTVMTSVYGVTAVGAREQISARLSERGWANSGLSGPDKDLLFGASKYLADQTLEALGEMFGSAKQIMDWLAGERWADCAMTDVREGVKLPWPSL